jgi:CubicO group peptidase (beta-lactamase class C family)
MTVGLKTSCLSSLILSAAAPLSASAAPSPDPAMVSQRLLDELVVVSGVPGMGAAVWQGDRLTWSGSAGYRDAERQLRVDDKTIFRLASVSKLLASTAAAKLHEEGKLDIDAPVTTILPWLSNGWAPLTARQLAAHISGMPHYSDEDRAARGSTHYPTSRAAVAIFEQRPLLRPPGEAYSYSSWGFTLLGALVEQRSGMLYPDYVMREVTPGLAIMRDATDGPHPNASIAYEFVDRAPVQAKPFDFSYTWPGGGMGATPAALASFGGSMLQNKIVSAETFDWMLQPARLIDGREVTDEEEGYRLGFGWRLSPDEDGAPTTHHNGVTVGARSTLLLWRDEQTAVSLLSNARWTASIDRSARMIAAPHRPLPKALVTKACPVKAARYSGTFNGKPIQGIARFNLDAGLCVGSIEATGELQQWLSGGSQKAAGDLRLVGLDGVGGLARAGLVTPYGIYDWRAAADGSFKVPFGGTRDLVVTLAD